MLKMYCYISSGMICPVLSDVWNSVHSSDNVFQPVVLQQTKPAEMDWFREAAEETAGQVWTGVHRLLWSGFLCLVCYPVTTRDNQVNDQYPFTPNPSAVLCLLIHLFLPHRYQYYLQLKKDVLEGKISCSIEQAIHLASLAVQGIVGLNLRF